MNTQTGQSSAPVLAPPAKKAVPVNQPNPLKKALAPAPAPPAADSTLRETIEMFPVSESYRMQESDIGFTAGEIAARLKGETTEMTPLEEKILDGLLFQMYYEHRFTIGKRGSFTLRTVGPQAMHSTPVVILKRTKEDKALEGRTTIALEGAVTVARMLAEYNGKRICQFETQREFESVEALEQRLEFVLDLPLAVVNAIGDRSNAFTNMVREAVKKDTSSFS